MGGELDVVEADDGEVFGDAQAGLGGGADGADGHQIRAGEDRRGRLLEREQLAVCSRPDSA